MFRLLALFYSLLADFFAKMLVLGGLDFSLGSSLIPSLLAADYDFL